MKSLALNTFLVILLAAVAIGGPVGQPRINGRRVAVHTTRQNWFKASEICRKQGMQLLTIRSPQENMEAVQLGKQYNLEWVWTAGSDLAQSRRWTWATDGQAVKEFYWANNEPSDKRENCIEAQMEGFPSNWNDNDCRKIRPFICEEAEAEVDVAYGDEDSEVDYLVDI